MSKQSSSFNYQDAEITTFEAIGALYSQQLAHSEEIEEHWLEKAFEPYKTAAKEYKFKGAGRSDKEKMSNNFADMLSDLDRVNILNKFRSGKLPQTMEDEKEIDPDFYDEFTEEYDNMSEIIDPIKMAVNFVDAQNGIMNEEKFKEFGRNYSDEIMENYGEATIENLKYAKKLKGF